MCEVDILVNMVASLKISQNLFKSYKSIFIDFGGWASDFNEHELTE